MIAYTAKGFIGPGILEYLVVTYAMEENVLHSLTSFLGLFLSPTIHVSMARGTHLAEDSAKREAATPFSLVLFFL